MGDVAFSGPLTTTDALDRVTQESYNAEGTLISTINALGQATTQTIDPAGQVTAVTDPLSDKTTTGYDVPGLGEPSDRSGGGDHVQRLRRNRRPDRHRSRAVAGRRPTITMPSDAWSPPSIH